MAGCRVGDCQKSRENLDKKRIIYVVRSAKSMLLIIISHFKIIFKRTKSAKSHLSKQYILLLININ